MAKNADPAPALVWRFDYFLMVCGYLYLIPEARHADPCFRSVWRDIVQRDQATLTNQWRILTIILPDAIVGVVSINQK